MPGSFSNTLDRDLTRLRSKELAANVFPTDTIMSKQIMHLVPEPSIMPIRASGRNPAFIPYRSNTTSFECLRRAQVLWIYQTAANLQLQPMTMELAIQYLDRALFQSPAIFSKLSQFLACMCLRIAVKYNEEHPVYADFVQVSKNLPYDNASQNRWELIILDMLEWKLDMVTLCDVVNVWSLGCSQFQESLQFSSEDSNGQFGGFHPDSYAMKRVYHFISMIVADGRFRNTRPSLIGSAVFFSVMHAFDLIPEYINQMIRSLLDSQDILETVLSLEACVTADFCQPIPARSKNLLFSNSGGKPPTSLKRRAEHDKEDDHEFQPSLEKRRNRLAVVVDTDELDELLSPVSGTGERSA